MRRPIGILDWITWGIALAVTAVAGWTLQDALRGDHSAGDRSSEAAIAVLPGADGAVVRIGRNPRLLPLEQLTTSRLQPWWAKQRTRTLLLQVDPRVTMGELASAQRRLRDALSQSVHIEWAVMTVRDDRPDSN